MFELTGCGQCLNPYLNAQSCSFYPKTKCLNLYLCLSTNPYSLDAIVLPKIFLVAEILPFVFGLLGLILCFRFRWVFIFLFWLTCPFGFS